MLLLPEVLFRVALGDDAADEPLPSLQPLPQLVPAQTLRPAAHAFGKRVVPSSLVRLQ
jgi:hypothetical protein